MSETSLHLSPVQGSQRRLVLYLSGRWKAHCSRAIQPNDLLFCAPGFAARAPGFDWTELPRVPRKGLSELARGYTAVIFGDDVDARDHLDSKLANTHFEYGISPIGAQLEAIEGLIDQEKPDRVLVIASDTRLDYVPALGIVTKESSRGSADLLGALVARAVTAGLSGVSLERIHTRGDALSKPLVRSLVLRCAAIALAGLNAIRMTLSPLGDSTQVDPSSNLLTVVRSPGQSQHAIRLLHGVPNAAVMIIPQFTAGNSLPRIMDMVEQDRRFFRPANVDVWRAFLAAVFRRNASLASDDGNGGTVKVGRFNVAISTNDLRRELHLFPALTFHEMLLSYSLRRLGNIRRIIGFEIKGGFSAAEAMAGRVDGVETATVQTVLVPPRPLPVFPWADVFHADSRSSANRIVNIGQRGKGQVVFSGSPHEQIPLTPFVVLKEVLFLSQPYELAHARALLSELAVQARSERFKIRVRLHPRDSAENYGVLLAEYADCISISDREALHADFASADLCVTRVSSAAKEALSAGKPILICLMSEYDRSIVADYIATDELASDYIAHDVTDLGRLLTAPERVCSAGAVLQERILDDKLLHDLRLALKA